MVENAKEQKAVAWILKLHKRGESLRGIAKQLNDHGIEPKRASRWLHSSVLRIVQRPAKPPFRPVWPTGCPVGLFGQVPPTKIRPRRAASWTKGWPSGLAVAGELARSRLGEPAFLALDLDLTRDRGVERSVRRLTAWA